MRKYEVAYCTKCRTEMRISKEHRNSVIKCLCGKSFMVGSINGKYKLCELEERKGLQECR